MKPPFSGGEQVIYEADQRLEGFTFTENLHTAIIGAGGGGRGGGGGGGGRGAGRAQTSYLIDFANPKEAPKPLWTSGPSRYNNPGSPVEKALPNGGRVVVLDGDNVFLQGAGSFAHRRSPVPESLQPLQQGDRRRSSSATTITTR